MQRVAERASVIAGAAVAWGFRRVDAGVLAAACGLTSVALASSLLAHTECKEGQQYEGLCFFVGIILGPLLLADLADRRGRRASLLVSASLMLAGSIGCLLVDTWLPILLRLEAATDCSATHHLELSVWQVVLGLGVAGELPAALAFSAESSRVGGGSKASGLALARTYCCLAGGRVLTSMVCAACLTFGGSVKLAWRIGFGCCSMLAFLALIARVFFATEAPLYAQAAENNVARTHAGLALVWKSRQALSRALAGTCLSCLSIGFALTSLGPLLWESREDAATPALAELRAALLSVPGFMAGALFIQKSRRERQLAGFSVTALAFLVLAVAKYVDAGNTAFTAIASLHMVIAGGAGATALLIPAELFPTCVRASCLGLSTACGSLGGLTAWLMLPVFGVTAASSCSALVCILGLLTTLQLTPSCEIPGLLQALQMLRPGKSARESVAEALAQGDQFRPCPHCDVMVERDGGCNVITCDNCGAGWCFACGGTNCLAWSCSSLRAASPLDLDALPNLLWPPPARERPLIESS